MFDGKYRLRYLPVFFDDLDHVVSYISVELNNKKAASDLIDSVERAITERLPVAESFEQYKSVIDRKYPYYRIYVKNFIVFYVVINDGDIRTMEVRRLLYSKQDIDNLVGIE